MNKLERLKNRQEKLKEAVPTFLISRILLVLILVFACVGILNYKSIFCLIAVFYMLCFSIVKEWVEDFLPCFLIAFSIALLITIFLDDDTKVMVFELFENIKSKLRNL